MNVFNSRAGQHEDDSDITIINPSMNDNNQESLTNSQTPVTTTTTANNFNFPSTSDYIFVHHDPLEDAKKIENALINYVRDLKKDSNSQLDCDKQLVIRLIDLIRPAYSNNQQKLNELNQIQDDIGVLHDKRFVQQREKIEELRAEIVRLNRMLFPTSNDESIYEDQFKSYSIYNSLPAGYSVTGYGPLSEIENDTKKLHEIVQSQRDQINEIAELITKASSAATSIEQPEPIPKDQTTVTNVKTQEKSSQSIGFDRSFVNGLLDKIRNINKPQLPINTYLESNEPDTTTILTIHSPGSSPSDSMNTLIRNTITPSIDEPKELERVDQRSIEPERVDETPIEPERDDQRSIEPKRVDETPVELKRDDQRSIEQPEIVDVRSEPVNPVPTSPLSPDALRICPVCNYEFPPICNDVEMYEHIDRCLFPGEQTNPPTEYECPRCSRHFPADDETTYLQHMSDCFNNQFE